MSVNPRAATAGRAFCAAVSSASGEPLAATASRIDHWILVEYRGAWARDVLGGSLLLARAEGAPARAARGARRSRLLFVKQPRAPRARRAARVLRHVESRARSGSSGSRSSTRTTCASSTLAAALARRRRGGTPIERAALRRVHARQARPLLRAARTPALRRAAARDRRRPRLAVDARRRRPLRGQRRRAPARPLLRPRRPRRRRRLLAAQPSGQVDLDRYRGRSAYSFPVQAAEHAIRESEGLLGIDELSLARLERARETTRGASASGPRTGRCTRSTSPRPSRTSPCT